MVVDNQPSKLLQEQQSGFRRWRDRRTYEQGQDKEGRVIGGCCTLPMEGRNVRAVLAAKTVKTTYPAVTTKIKGIVPNISWSHPFASGEFVSAYDCGCGRWRDLCRYSIIAYIPLVVVMSDKNHSHPKFPATPTSWAPWGHLMAR